MEPRYSVWPQLHIQMHQTQPWILCSTILFKYYSDGWTLASMQFLNTMMQCSSQRERARQRQKEIQVGSYIGLKQLNKASVQDSSSTLGGRREEEGENEQDHVCPSVR